MMWWWPLAEAGGGNRRSPAFAAQPLAAPFEPWPRSAAGLLGSATSAASAVGTAPRLASLEAGAESCEEWRGEDVMSAWSSVSSGDPDVAEMLMEAKVQDADVESCTDSYGREAAAEEAQNEEVPTDWGSAASTDGDTTEATTEAAKVDEVDICATEETHRDGSPAHYSPASAEREAAHTLMTEEGKRNYEATEAFEGALGEELPKGCSSTLHAAMATETMPAVTETCVGIGQALAAVAAAAEAEDSSDLELLGTVHAEAARVNMAVEAGCHAEGKEDDVQGVCLTDVTKTRDMDTDGFGEMQCDGLLADCGSPRSVDGEEVEMIMMAEADRISTILSAASFETITERSFEDMASIQSQASPESEKSVTEGLFMEATGDETICTPRFGTHAEVRFFMEVATETVPAAASEVEFAEAEPKAEARESVSDPLAASEAAVRSTSVIRRHADVWTGAAGLDAESPNVVSATCELGADAAKRIEVHCVEVESAEAVEMPDVADSDVQALAVPAHAAEEISPETADMRVGVGLAAVGLDVFLREAASASSEDGAGTQQHYAYSDPSEAAVSHGGCTTASILSHQLSIDTSVAEQRCRLDSVADAGATDPSSASPGHRFTSALSPCFAIDDMVDSGRRRSCTGAGSGPDTGGTPQQEGEAFASSGSPCSRRFDRGSSGSGSLSPGCARTASAFSCAAECAAERSPSAEAVRPELASPSACLGRRLAHDASLSLPLDALPCVCAGDDGGSVCSYASLAHDYSPRSSGTLYSLASSALTSSIASTNSSVEVATAFPERRSFSFVALRRALAPAAVAASLLIDAARHRSVLAVSGVTQAPALPHSMHFSGARSGSPNLRVVIPRMAPSLPLQGVARGSAGTEAEGRHLSSEYAERSGVVEESVQAAQAERVARGAEGEPQDAAYTVAHVAFESLRRAADHGGDQLLLPSDALPDSLAEADGEAMQLNQATSVDAGHFQAGAVERVAVGHFVEVEQEQESQLHSGGRRAAKQPQLDIFDGFGVGLLRGGAPHESSAPNVRIAIVQPTMGDHAGVKPIITTDESLKPSEAAAAPTSAPASSVVVGATDRSTSGLTDVAVRAALSGDAAAAGGRTPEVPLAGEHIVAEGIRGLSTEVLAGSGAHWSCAPNVRIIIPQIGSRLSDGPAEEQRGIDAFGRGDDTGDGRQEEWSSPSDGRLQMFDARSKANAVSDQDRVHDKSTAVRHSPQEVFTTEVGLTEEGAKSSAVVKTLQGAHAEGGVPTARVPESAVHQNPSVNVSTDMLRLAGLLMDEQATRSSAKCSSGGKNRRELDEGGNSVQTESLEVAHHALDARGTEAQLMNGSASELKDASDHYDGDGIAGSADVIAVRDADSACAEGSPNVRARGPYSEDSRQGTCNSSSAEVVIESQGFLGGGGRAHAGRQTDDAVNEITGGLSVGAQAETTERQPIAETFGTQGVGAAVDTLRVYDDSRLGQLRELLEIVQEDPTVPRNHALSSVTPPLPASDSCFLETIAPQPPPSERPAQDVSLHKGLAVESSFVEPPATDGLPSEALLPEVSPSAAPASEAPDALAPQGQTLEPSLADVPPSVPPATGELRSQGRVPVWPQATAPREPFPEAQQYQVPPAEGVPEPQAVAHLDLAAEAPQGVDQSHRIKYWGLVSYLACEAVVRLRRRVARAVASSPASPAAAGLVAASVGGDVEAGLLPWPPASSPSAEEPSSPPPLPPPRRVYAPQGPPAPPSSLAGFGAPGAATFGSPEADAAPPWASRAGVGFSSVPLRASPFRDPPSMLHGGGAPLASSLETTLEEEEWMRPGIMPWWWCCRRRF